MCNRCSTDPRLQPRHATGPLACYLDGFLRTLIERGYTVATATAKIRFIRRLNQWLERRRLGVEKLNEAIVEDYTSYRKKNNYKDEDGPPTFRQFLSFLRNEGVIAAPTPALENSPFRKIERGFARHLYEERGLAKDTVHKNYLPTIRRFLVDRFTDGEVTFQSLCPQDISTFLIRHAHTMSPGRAQIMTTALRGFFRFLLKRGDISTDLAGAVPTVANWRLSGLPKYLEPEQVEQILRSCDRSSVIGKRDYAVLLLLSRLGLRAGEIVHLALDDIFWDVGELLVRGKSAREERLPLPDDVGYALATYLRYSRPRCPSRKVFIRNRAPRQGFADSAAIGNILKRALVRAGIDVGFKGAHLLRHTLATNMLRGGATFSEIGEILRHQLPCTTEIYAKVDLTALRSIAQPWLGGEI
jgi:site-specific recombinase XerD